MNNTILLLSCILELYIIIDFFGAFFPKREQFMKKKRLAAFTLLIVLCYFGVNTLKLSALNMTTFLIIQLIYLCFVFKSNLKEKILYILFTSSIFFGCEFLFAVILNIPSFIVGENSITDLTSMPWHVFTLKLLTYLICNIFKQLNKKATKHMNTKVFLYYLCIPFASIGIMLLTYYSGLDFHVDSHTKIMLCIYFAIMQIGNILIFYAFQRYSEELYTSMEKQLIITEQNLNMEYFSHVQEINSKHRAFIHDTNHYIKTLGNLISQNRTSEALGIINNLNIELENNTTSTFTTNSVLNSILSEKHSRALKNNIKMDIYVEPEVTFGTASDVDLITILCNLLDNALEATIPCSNHPSIIVRIYMENFGNMCVIKISNAHAGELKKIGDSYISTKTETGIHGVGLKSVKRTAEKCGGYLECYEENNQFISVVILPVEYSQDASTK